MQNTFTPEGRLEIYKEAKLECEKLNYTERMYVIIGVIIRDKFSFQIPWLFWSEIQPYFPEFRHWKCDDYKYFTRTQRIKILKSAIAEVTKLIKSKA